MARGINQVILMGRLTRDPEMRTTASGKNVCSFGLAVDRQGQEGQADFFDVIAWEKTGELVNDTGKKRNRVEAVAFDVTFLDGPSDGNSSNQSNNNSSQEKTSPVDDITDDPIDLSEIPF